MEKFGTWQVKQSGGRYYLQREVLPRVGNKIVWDSFKGKYDPSDKEAVYAMKRRFNVTYEQRKNTAEERYNFDHAYINIRVVEAFETHLKRGINSPEAVKSLMSYLRLYTFEYFIRKQKLPSPVDWPKKEAGFGEYLLKANKSISLTTRVIQTTNRFLEFLRLQYPDEIPLMQLDPVPRTKIKYMEAIVEMEKKSGKYFINDSLWIIIKNKIDRSILPHVKLGHDYGLRVSEVLGLDVDHIYEDFIRAERQLLTVAPKYGPLKDRDQRDIPHWFMKPDDAYDLIKDLKIMHPDTLSHMFVEEMKRITQLVRLETKDMKFDITMFTFHDLRSAWITKNLRKYNHRDVQLGAGHTDISTTMGYAMDDREMSRKKFKPKP